MTDQLTHASVIRTIGGWRRLAYLLGIKPHTTQKWMRRGIPPLYWNRVAEFAQAVGMNVTQRDLERMKPERPRTIEHGNTPTHPGPELP